MNHAQLTDAVRGRELLALTATERHGGPYPNRTRLFPGTLRMADAPVSEPSRVHAPRPVEAGHDSRVEGSSRECPNCHGDGEVHFRHNDLDPQTEDSEPCRVCGGIGALPIPRQIPNAPRAA